MRLVFFTVVFFGLLTCHHAEGKDKNSDNGNFGCFVNDLPNGFELVCDGVPHKCLNGKDGAEGQPGHNGSPGQKGDAGIKGDKGDPGVGGRSVVKTQLCDLTWEGSPTYKINYNIFTFSDGTKEAMAIVDSNESGVEANSSIWIKDDPRFNSAFVDIGGFQFTQTGDSAVVLYRSTGRTDTMNCKF